MNALRVLAPPRLRPRPHAVNRQVDRPDQHPCRRAPPARRRPPRPRGADQGAAVLSADRKGCRAPAVETYDLSPKERPTSSESRLLWDIGRAVHHHVDRVFNAGIICPFNGATSPPVGAPNSQRSSSTAVEEGCSCPRPHPLAPPPHPPLAS